MDFKYYFFFFKGKCVVKRKVKSYIRLILCIRIKFIGKLNFFIGELMLFYLLVRRL